MMTRNPCGPGGTGVPGVNQVQRPPTFTDYMTELSGGQDVLLWMEGQYPLETAHVVTGVGYDNTPGVGAFGLGTVTISDPWTHATNPPLPPVATAFHNDGLVPPWQGKPDHNTSQNHAVYPGTDPYNLCDVSQVNPLKIQCWYEDLPLTPQVWQVVDMIFVSPLSAPAPAGGLAELPDAAQAPSRQSDPSTGSYAALAGVLAAVILSITAGAWYARRRFSRG
jgi:hypothetical protein